MQWVQQDKFDVWVGKRLPMLLTLLLVALLSITLAELVLSIITPDSEPIFLPPPETTVDTPVPPPLKREDFGLEIANQHLFGQAPVAPPPKPKPKPQPVQQPKIQKTPLNIKLHGVIAYGGGEGIAMIDIGKGVTNVYRRGNALEEGGNTIVSKVLADKIIIERDGQAEEVPLPGLATANFSGSSNTALLPTSVPTPFAPPPTAPSNLPAPMGQAMAESGSLQHLGELRDRLLNNPMSLNELISMVPYKENGEQIGYKISPRKNRSLFKQMGLKPGDVIVEINGIKLNSIANSMNLMNKLGSVTHLSMQVKRGNETVPVDISF